MGLSGKLLGAGIGFVLGGPLGAVVGGVIGHFVKDAPPANGLFELEEGIANDPGIRRHQEELYFVASMLGILSAMIRADEDVDEAEVRTVRRFFSERLGYRGESLEIVRELLKGFLRDGVDLDQLCLEFRARTDLATRLLLVECLEEVASADGRMRDGERTILQRVSKLLGVDLRSASKFGAGSNGDKDFRTLGIERSATPEEIKGAYRELVKKYHPDKVEHLGVEFRELAHRKFLEVQEAYERVRGERGF